VENVSSPEATAASGSGNSARLDKDSVAALAATAVLSAPGARSSVALGGLLPFLLTPEPVVEELPALFLPAETGTEHVDPGALLEIAVAGKIVYSQVRWLDELADSLDRPLALPGAVHRLSEALSREAYKRFAAGLRDSGEEAADFFSSLASLNARYAASLALDGASSRGAQLVRLSLEDYVKHAKCRAAPLRAPLDALHVLVTVREEDKELGRSCFELTAAAMQLRDDTLDVEEDYADGRLSWVVAETQRHLGDPDGRPDADEFYEAALLAGYIDRNLAAAEQLYAEALSLADGRFPGCVEFLRNEARQTRAMKEDMARIVSSARRMEGRPAPATPPNDRGDRHDEPAL
jgi:hypothetical protein